MRLVRFKSLPGKLISQFSRALEETDSGGARIRTTKVHTVTNVALCNQNRAEFQKTRVIIYVW